MKPLLPLLALLLTAAAGAAEGTAMPEPSADDRILVVAPHPDDGQLCCAGYLQRALANRAQVAMAWVTAGDGFTIDAVLINRHFRQSGAGMIQLGRIRIGEALAAARTVGLPREHLFVLGYPDGGVATLLGADGDTPFRSPHTDSSVIPYGEAPSFGKAITGRQLQQDLADVVEAFRPTVVFAPHAADLHTDHAATGELVHRVLEARGEQHRLHRYVIHAGSHWPAPRALRPDLPLEPAPALAGLPWQRFDLKPAERDLKLDALRRHDTQWRVMAPYLESFVRSNELFLAD